MLRIHWWFQPAWAIGVKHQSVGVISVVWCAFQVSSFPISCWLKVLYLILSAHPSAHCWLYQLYPLRPLRWVFLHIVGNIPLVILCTAILLLIYTYDQIMLIYDYLTIFYDCLIWCVMHFDFFFSDVVTISLVGGLNPSEKIWKSVELIIPNIWKNRIHVPNHQPVLIMTCFVFFTCDVFFTKILDSSSKAIPTAIPIIFLRPKTSRFCRRGTATRPGSRSACRRRWHSPPAPGDPVWMLSRWVVGGL